MARAGDGVPIVNGGTRDPSTINRRIAAGRAVVRTESELAAMVRAGREVDLADVDVVTVAYRAGITGSAAMLVVPVADRGVFTRAERIWLNGVPACPGPAPNERLGVVDTLIFADQPGSQGASGYDGAELLIDLLRGHDVTVECRSVEGHTFRGSVRLEQLEFARMYVYDCAFPARPGGVAATAQPDAPGHLASTRAGTRVLLNGAHGIVVGCGTHSARERPSLSLAADLREMNPSLMEGTRGGGAGRIHNSVALALPVLDPQALRELVLWSVARCREEADAKQVDREVAAYAKALVERGELLLTDTDLGLRSWT